MFKKRIIFNVSLVTLLSLALCFTTVKAFPNLSVGGNGSSTGGSGSTPSLSQVTAIGASTSDKVTFTGGVVSSAGGTSYLTDVANASYALNTTGLESHVRTETESNSARPVWSAMTEVVAPTSTAVADFHGIDLILYSSSTNMTTSRLYPFESTAQQAGSGLISELFAGMFQTAIANGISGNVTRATGIRVSPQIQGSGNIYTNRGIYLTDPVHGSTGNFGDNSAIVIDTQTAGTSSNYGIYDDTNGNYFKKLQVGVASSTLANFALTSAGDIGPSSTDLYSLGSTSSSFKNIMASGTLDIGGDSSMAKSIIRVNDLYGNINFGQSNTDTPNGGGGYRLVLYDTNNNGVYDGNTYGWGMGAGAMWFNVQGTGAVKFYNGGTVNLNVAQTELDSNTNNSFDLGTSGIGFRNVYVSSTMFAVNTSSTNASTTFLAIGSNFNVYGAATSTFFGTGGVSSTHLNLSNLAANPITDNLLCITAGGVVTSEATSCTISSAFFKEHIQSLSTDDLLAEVMKLHAVGFDYKEGAIPSEGTNGGGPASTGFIAEEVAMVDPQLVSYTQEYTAAQLAFEEKNYPSVILHKNGKTLIPRTVDYGRISYLNTGAIQAQQRAIQAQQKEIEEIKKEQGKQKGILSRIVNFFSKVF